MDLRGITDVALRRRVTAWPRYPWLDLFDLRLTRWLALHSLRLMSVGMGVVFLWFGALKSFPSLSPAEDLALRTIDALTLGMIPAGVSLVLLAALECSIGIGFLTGRYMRLTLLLMAFQMAGALTPLVLFPEEVFTDRVYVPTLEGQYIIKNLVLIGAGLVIGATVRGGRIVADPTEPDAGLDTVDGRNDHGHSTDGGSIE